MKKEEEREKQWHALERKKKLQEKAAAKAAIRAQKEVEKKQKVNEPSALRRAKDQKETALKYRRTAKTQGGLPKAIPRKKNVTDYWIWAAAAVAVMLLAVGYSCLLRGRKNLKGQLSWGNVTVDVNV